MDLRAGEHIESPQPASSRTVFSLVALPLFALYLATATQSLPYHNDALTNVLTAWSLGAKGTAILDEHAELVDQRGRIGWVTESPRGPVAQYPPGTALLAAPLYAVFRDAPLTEIANANPQPGNRPLEVPLPAFWPAAVVAAGATASAIGMLAMLTASLGLGTRGGIFAGYVMGLGTSAWSVAADALWQHGPGMLWIALGSWMIHKNRWFGAGMAYSLVILTRPPVALAGVAVGLWLLLRRRWRESFKFLGGAVPGAVALLAYNWWLFGRITVSGAYGQSFTARVVGEEASGSTTSDLANIVDAFVNPRYGLFVWTPVVLVLLAGLYRAARAVPGWVNAVAVGGVCVLLLQLLANRASGGGDFLFYRYPLEPLAAAAPLLAISWQRLWSVGLPAKAILVVTTLWSVAGHAIAAWRFR